MDFIDATFHALRRGEEVTQDKIIFSYEGWTVLHHAAQAGNVCVAKFVLDQGIPINELDRHRIPVLHIVAFGGHNDMLRFLLERGFDIQTQNRDGNTALHIAVQRGHLNIVQILLQGGANVNSPCKSGFTPLHSAMASLYCSTEMLEILLHHGARINERCKDGRTPLHYGIPCPTLGIREARSDYSKIKTLLKYGADPHSIDNDGNSIRDTIQKMGANPRLLDILDEITDIKEPDGL